MKKLLIALALTSVTPGAAWAQNEAEPMKIVHYKKGQEPQQVMRVLQKDFPASIVQDVSSLPGGLYGQRWAVEESDLTNGAPADINYYEVKASNPRMAYTAVYDKNGKLLNYRQVVKQTALPLTVDQTIASTFPGWRIVGDRERLTFHGKTNHTHVAYRVEIQKGEERKNVFLDDQGRITRITKKPRIRV